MVKKFLLNIFYNIAIIMLVLSGIWAYNNKHLLYIIPVAAAIGLFIFLKVRLVKQIKTLTRKS